MKPQYPPLTYRSQYRQLEPEVSNFSVTPSGQITNQPRWQAVVTELPKWFDVVPENVNPILNRKLSEMERIVNLRNYIDMTMRLIQSQTMTEALREELIRELRERRMQLAGIYFAEVNHAVEVYNSTRHIAPPDEEECKLIEANKLLSEALRSVLRKKTGIEEKNLFNMGETLKALKKMRTGK